MAQADLISRADVLSLGAGSDFVDWFKVRTVEIACDAAGALGTAAFKWRFAGEDQWSAPELSEGGSSWTWSMPDPAFAEVIFPAQSYSDGDVWTVAASGTVTTSAGSHTGVSAIRRDIVAGECTAITSDIVTWCQPRVVPPILSLGAGQKGWAAHIVTWRLKVRRGANPQPGNGDAAMLDRANAAEQNFKGIGASAMRPPDIVDSSTDGTAGAGLSLLPISDSLRGW